MSRRRNTFIRYIASISGDIAVGAVAYEEHTWLVMQPLVLEADGYSASPDGMTLDGDLVLEIKCPLRGTRSDLWHDVQSGQVPTHYGIQVQHQLMVSGAALAHLWVFDGNQGILHAIEPDATHGTNTGGLGRLRAVPQPYSFRCSRSANERGARPRIILIRN